jgi:hypothetical protein
MRRVPPLFPPRVWNVHEVTLVGNARTNNILEGWNNKFRSLVGHHHPTVWTFIKALQMEQACTVTQLAMMENGNAPPHKRVRQVNIDYQQRLQRLCNDFVNGIRNLEDFLRAAGNNIRH